MAAFALAAFVRKLALGIVKSALPPGTVITAKILADPRSIVRGALSGPMRRNVVMHTMQRLRTARKPMPSGQYILNMLRGQGFGIRTQDFYRMFSSFKKQGTFGAKLVVQPPATRILKADVPEWPGFMSGRYLYQFDMYVWDYKEDKWKTKTFRMSSSRLYNKGRAEEQIRSWWSESGFNKEVELATVRVTEVWKSPTA